MPASTSRKPPLVAADAPPLERLPLSVEVASLRDVAVGLAELAWLDGRIETEARKLDGLIALAKYESEQRQIDEVDGQRVTYQERRAAVEDAIKAYAKAHPAEICVNGKKTRTFSHGEVSLRQVPADVEPRKGKTWDDILEACTGVFARFVRTKRFLEKSQLAKEARDGRLPAEDLKLLGCRLNPPHDAAHVKPHRSACLPPALVD